MYTKHNNIFETILDIILNDNIFEATVITDNIYRTRIVIEKYKNNIIKLTIFRSNHSIKLIVVITDNRERIQNIFKDDNNLLTNILKYYTINNAYAELFKQQGDVKLLYFIDMFKNNRYEKLHVKSSNVNVYIHDEPFTAGNCSIYFDFGDNDDYSIEIYGHIDYIIEDIINKNDIFIIIKLIETILNDEWIKI